MDRSWWSVLTKYGPWEKRTANQFNILALRTPWNSMKRQKDRTLKEGLSRLVGAQYAIGDQWRNNYRKNKQMKPKQHHHPVVDVTGDGSKVWCCKKQYCVGTWNVRSMNQGKLEVVKQEMERVNIDILGISELKSTEMGEFSSDDHCIYYCGQESLRRNGVAIIVNKRVWNAVLGCNLKNDRIISVHFQGKPFNITVIQVYALTSNAEKVEQFYEDLQDFLELTSKKDVIIGDCNTKEGSQEIPGITGKFGLEVQDDVGQRLIELCQENALIIANILFQKHKRRLHIDVTRWSIPKSDWLYSLQPKMEKLYTVRKNKIESWLWLRSWTQFRLKLKKAGKTTRPFRYDLNQIPYDYTVEVRNRFKGLDLIDRVPEELWMEAHDIVKAGIKIISKKKKC